VAANDNRMEQPELPIKPVFQLFRRQAQERDLAARCAAILLRLRFVDLEMVEAISEIEETLTRYGI